MEDFLLTSMSSQLGSLQFISEGSTERKKILAKFLDLDVFDQKFKIAKEEAADLRGALKRLEGKEFDQDIFEAEKEIIFNESETKEQTNKCEKIKKEIKKLDKTVTGLVKKIDLIPTEIINLEEVLDSIREKELKITDLIAERVETAEKFNDKEDFLTKIDGFLTNFDIEEVKNKKKIATEKQSVLNELSNQVKSEETKCKNQEKKAKLLKEVPCGSEFSHCKFIKDAYVAIDKLVLTKSSITDLNLKEKSLLKEIESLNLTQIDDHIEKYSKCNEKCRDIIQS